MKDVKDSKPLLLPPRPAIGTQEMRDNYPDNWIQVQKKVEALLEVAMNIGNSVSDIERMRKSLYSSFDCGLVKLAIDGEGYLTLLMWHFTKGCYLPMIASCFNRIDSALALQMSSYMLSEN